MDTTAKKTCLSSSALGLAVSVTVALILEAFCWGFTVDDAWIVSRVAHHGLSTGRFTFNLGGPFTDAVTPLGFAHLLAGVGSVLGLTSRADLWALARALGAVSFVFSIALAGRLLGGEGRRGVVTGFALTFFTLPAAVWAGAGLETPLVGLFVMAGAMLLESRTPSVGALLFGSAAAWRPELAPFLFCWMVCRETGTPNERKRIRFRVFLPFLGLLVVPALVRWFLFGSLIPLAAVAKVAEPRTALFYAAVTALWSGLGWLVLLRDGAFRRPGLWGVPWCVHLVALFFSGGDWMPALRLSAPLFPLMVWAVGRSLQPTLRFWLGVIPAVGFTLVLAVSQGGDFRAVTSRRVNLISAGAPAFKDTRVVAATDIGWVGLATNAHIVDLAGVTDPTIAALPGGHTSKMISPGLFSDRDVDTWVIRSLDRGYRPGEPLELVVAAYLVDARLLSRNADLGFVGVATIPLEGTTGQYVIARRVAAATAVLDSRTESFFR